jgi:hypothetical protein
MDPPVPKGRQALKVPLDLPGPKVRLELKVQLEVLVPLVNKDPPELLVLQAKTGLRVELEPLEVLGPLEVLENRVPLVAPVHRVQQDLKVLKVHRVPLVNLVKRVQPELSVPVVPQVKKDHQVLPVKRVSKALQDQQEVRVLLERRVSTVPLAPKALQA